MANEDSAKDEIAELADLIAEEINADPESADADPDAIEEEIRPFMEEERDLFSEGYLILIEEIARRKGTVDDDTDPEAASSEGWVKL